jgi:DNA polymerase III alpha subunit
VRPPDELVVPYAELHCHSNFSFLDGASGPDALVEEAIRLGLHGLAVTDHDGFAGAPLFAEIAQKYDQQGNRLETVYGAELSLGLSGPQGGVPDPEGNHLLVLAEGVEGYHRLAAAITDAQLRGTRRDARSTTSRSCPLVAVATGWCSPAVARVRSAQLSRAAVPKRRRPSSTGSPHSSGTTGSSWS